MSRQPHPAQDGSGQVRSPDGRAGIVRHAGVLSPVFPGDHPADAAARPFGISRVPGYDMDVEVHYGLARNPADIDPDIVAVRGIFLIKDFLQSSMISRREIFSSRVVSK
jgi:hypothetical protein